MTGVSVNEFHEYASSQGQNEAIMRRKAEDALDEKPAKRQRTDTNNENKETKTYTRKAILEDLSKSLLKELNQQGKNLTQEQFKNQILEIFQTAPFECKMFSDWKESFEDKSIIMNEQICRLITCPIDNNKMSPFTFMVRNQRWDLLQVLLKVIPANAWTLHLLCYFAANSFEDNAKELNVFIEYYQYPLSKSNFDNDVVKRVLENITIEFFFKKFIEENDIIPTNIYFPQKLALLIQYKLYREKNYIDITIKNLGNSSAWSLPTVELLMQQCKNQSELKYLFNDGLDLLTKLLDDCFFGDDRDALTPFICDVVKLLIKYDFYPQAIQLPFCLLNKNPDRFAEIIIAINQDEDEMGLARDYFEFLQNDFCENDIIFFTQVYNKLKNVNIKLPYSSSILGFFGPFLNCNKEVSAEIYINFLESNIEVIKKLESEDLGDMNDIFRDWLNWFGYLKEQKIDIMNENSIAQRYLAELLNWCPEEYLFNVNFSEEYGELWKKTWKEFCYGLKRANRNYLLGQLLFKYTDISLEDLDAFLDNQSSDSLSEVFFYLVDAVDDAPDFDEEALLLFFKYIESKVPGWIKNDVPQIEIYDRELTHLEYLLYLNKTDLIDQLNEVIPFLKTAFPDEMKKAQITFQKEFQHLDHEGVYRGKDNKQLSLIASVLKNKYHRDNSTPYPLLDELKKMENEVKKSAFQKLYPNKEEKEFELHIEALEKELPQQLLRNIENNGQTISREIQYYEAIRNHKICIARRCALRLVTSPTFKNYKDASGVTIFLALAYIADAIHDKNNFTESESKDRLHIFIDVLCEIERTYNLNADGKDDKLSDNPSCAATSLSRLLRLMTLPRADGTTIPGMIQISTLNLLTAFGFYKDFCLLQFEALEKSVKNNLIEKIVEECAKASFTPSLLMSQSLLEFVLNPQRIKEFKNIHADYFSETETAKRFDNDLKILSECSFKDMFHDIYEVCRQCWKNKYEPKTTTSTTSKVYMTDVEEGKDSKEEKKREFKLFNSSNSSSSSSSSSAANVSNPAP